MPSIEITDTDFQRLQKFAVPLIDTPTSAITKILDKLEGLNGTTPMKPRIISHSSVCEFGAGNVPPLVHTKLMDARFNGAAPEKINWGSLVRFALTTAMAHCKTAKDLHRLSGANVVQGKKETDGYKFVPSHGFSFQGVSAEDAAKIVVRCAKALGVTASFEFEWRDKESAYQPGERGIVRV
jgi:hypothetical protein